MIQINLSILANFLNKLNQKPKKIEETIRTQGSQPVAFDYLDKLTRSLTLLSRYEDIRSFVDLKELENLIKENCWELPTQKWASVY